ncbi:MAG: hypothetical protein HN368_07335 [Spirochaetales bacterium]|jgi:hypothetical protein|nr:hypothetical protein [Spirochaetales bacterium]
MSQTIEEILSRNRAAHFVGRESEIQILLGFALSDDAAAVHVHGIGGIGKSALLTAFAGRARDAGAVVKELNCREMEPSENGVLMALGDAAGKSVSSVRDVALALAGAGERVVIAFDTFEMFRMVDTWLRNTFLPALAENTRVFFFGREPPVPAWLVAPEWQGMFHSITLGPLDDEAAEEMLQKCGLNDSVINRITRFAHGHPLALRLAAASVLERPELDLEKITSQTVVAQLTKTYIDDVQDAESRLAVEASAVVRRMTISLLRYMIPQVDTESVFLRLQELPIVVTTVDGLLLHESVQQAVASAMKVSDPVKYRELRRKAWRFYKNEVRIIRQAEIWRYSADMLFLIEQPLIRDAFFPPNPRPYAIEAAKPHEEDAIKAIIERFEGKESAAVMAKWLRITPENVFVAHDEVGSVAGLYMLFDPEKVAPGLIREDPVSRAIMKKLAEDPIPAKQNALVCRRWLDAKTGDAPSDLVCACFLDIKGYYVAMKPSLRRLFCVRTDYEGFDGLFRSLDAKYLKDHSANLDGRTYHTEMIDFGPGLFNGWITMLVGRELGIDESDILDVDACELVLDGTRITLTPLELGVMQFFEQHEGDVVTRASLLENVWGYGDYSGASNVVDTKIRSLRKKMREYAHMIETVSGMGYRYRRT